MRTNGWTDVPSVSEGLSSSLQLLVPAAPELGRENINKTFYVAETIPGCKIKNTFYSESEPSGTFSATT